MRGFAVIDQRSDADEVGIWCVTQMGHMVANTNAVVATPEDGERIGHAMTRGHAVFLTPRTTLGIGGLTSADLLAWVNETEEHKTRISEAVEEYRRRSKSKTIQLPEFPASIDSLDIAPADDSAGAWAFAYANLLGRVWSNWLAVDEQRRRRVERPAKPGKPWMMPEDLCSPNLAVLPGCVASSVHFRVHDLV